MQILLNKTMNKHERFSLQYMVELFGREMQKMQ